MLLWLLPFAIAARKLPVYEINLDVSPAQRFTKVFTDFNDSINAFVSNVLKGEVKDLLVDLVKRRGPEVDEMQQEIESAAKITGLEVSLAQGVQMMYELQTVMVPIDNVTIPWRGPGCTGIIARDDINGMIYHARNLDFSPRKYMSDLLYVGKFMKNGSELCRAQMVAGYQGVITGMKAGANGFTVEVNTRYPNHVGGNEEMLKNLLEESRPLNNWSLRKVLETAVDYEEAVSALSTLKYVSTEYNIVSGVGKGTILARDPDGVAHSLVYGHQNFENKDNYIIVTNFDYWDHDIREWFDPTAGEIGHPRRIVAQTILNNTEILTPAVLFEVLGAKGVIAKDTIFQAIMSVQSGLWNVSSPVDH